jgi:hypothetical protein
LPNLRVFKVGIDKYDGEIGNCVLAKRSEDMPDDQWKYLLARYLVEIKGANVYINSQALVRDLDPKKDGLQGKRDSVDDEQLLDIAEVCFLRIADVLIKKGQTVREAF